jgi:hypothetical protein
VLGPEPAVRERQAVAGSSRPEEEKDPYDLVAAKLAQRAMRLD